MTRDDGTVWRTPAAGCAACRERRVHHAEERMTHHPYAGNGFDGTRWSEPMLDPLLPLDLKGAPDPEENP